MRKNHVDYFEAVTALLHALYSYNNADYEALLTALKNGSLTGSCLSSNDRPAGTMEFHGINVDREVYHYMMINNVLPDIAAKWPTGDWAREGFKVKVQQDNATSYVQLFDPCWLEALEELNLDDKIELVAQPANSPDTNINDLAFFTALQSEYYGSCPRNTTELIAMVQQAFDQIWITYQSILNEIIKCAGDNNYKIPHMNKGRLERENNLPRVLEVTEEAMQYI